LYRLSTFILIFSKFDQSCHSDRQLILQADVQYPQVRQVY
jgi:hypothetical protein